MRCISEVIAGVLLYAFVLTMIAMTIPLTFRTLFWYYESARQDIVVRRDIGIYTSAALLRYGSTLYLTITSQRNLNVSYAITCISNETYSTLLSESVYIPANATLVRAATTWQSPCLAVISESDSVVYKVIEQ